MANVKQCLRDGFSTAGTPGTGLGAIARLSTFFDIYSVPALGTALVMQVFPDRRSIIPYFSQDCQLKIGAIQLPKAGEEISGDAWVVENQSDRSLILVADGLGSGPLAAEASREAVRILRENTNLSPKTILERAHEALRKTRGAAVAIATIDRERQSLCYAGIGNIAGAIATGTNRHSLVSHNGIVGHQIRKIQEFIYPWTSHSLLVMHSDGLGTQWSLEKYPGLATHYPSLIASVLYRDFHRSRDDVTVLVAKSQ
jgi:hypothetical protein